MSRQELPAGEFFDSPGNEAQDIFEEKAHVAKTASFCYSRKAISCKVKFFHTAFKGCFVSQYFEVLKMMKNNLGNRLNAL